MKAILTTSILFLSIQFCFAQAIKDSFYYKKISEPGIKFISVENGKYKVFTQKVGEGKIKLLLLHGGPVNTHEYFENFPFHLKNNDIEIYYYDQLGSYYSDQPNDTSIWNAHRFADEVEEVRKGLGLKEFFILGHSWGAMLGELYAAKYPEHLKGLILSNVPPEIKDTAKRNIFLIAWRDTVHNAIARLPIFSTTSAVTLDSIRYEIVLRDTSQYARLRKLYGNKRDSIVNRDYSYRLSETKPEPMVRNSLHINRKQRDESGFYAKIFQPDYPAADEKIKCPVLIIGGVHDRFFRHLYPEMKTQFLQTKVRIYLCPNGSHFSMWDDSEHYFPEIIRFLKEVQANSFDPDN